jgi:hypothetical protein
MSDRIYARVSEHASLIVRYGVDSKQVWEFLADPVNRAEMREYAEFLRKKYLADSGDPEPPTVQEAWKEVDKLMERGERLMVERDHYQRLLKAANIQLREQSVTIARFQSERDKASLDITDTRTQPLMPEDVGAQWRSEVRKLANQCRKTEEIYGRLVETLAKMAETSEADITEAMVEEVAEGVGCGRMAWDTVDPRELIAVSVRVWMRSFANRKHATGDESDG